MPDSPAVPSRFIQPLGMRVVVRLLPPDTRNRAGLYLPKTVEPSGTDALYGEVIEVARAEQGDEDIEGTNVSGVPHGAKILFAPDAGYRVPWQDDVRVIETKDVLAVVEELLPDEAH